MYGLHIILFGEIICCKILLKYILYGWVPSLHKFDNNNFKVFLTYLFKLNNNYNTYNYFL